MNTCRHLTRTALILALILSLPAMTHAQDFRVTPAGGGDGSSWANAATLPYALTNASDGNVIWIADGTYNGTTFNVTTNDLTLSELQHSEPWPIIRDTRL